MNGKLAALVVALALLSPAAFAQPCVSSICNVIGSAGQSNEVGQGRFVISGVDVGGAGAYSRDQSGVIAALKDAMPSPGTDVATWLRVGSRVTFVRNYFKPNFSPNTNVLVVPQGAGGVGFDGVSPNCWRLGCTVYENFVSAMQSALALNAGNTCQMIFWGGGEADANVGMTFPTYIGHFTTMVADFRSRVPKCANAPWFIRSMVPAFAYALGGRKAIQAALMELGTNYTASKFYYVSAEWPTLTENQDPATGTFDTVHFSGVAQRAMAWREYEQYATKYLCVPVVGGR